MTRDLLSDLPVLVLDAQAGGATPAHGDLLELGWAVVAGDGRVGPAQSAWVVPRTERRVPRAVRELTGWSERCVAEASDEAALWEALAEASAKLAGGASGAPTLIHFARFELPFLRDLHARLAPAERAFPLDVACLHAIAARLYPDLPRRNIRALAGHLGHAPELVRRAAGHVAATAFIWTALRPQLVERGVTTWSELKDWCEQTPSPRRPARRVFPFSAERRRALPGRPGVYRFVRRNGDVIYVGKAANVKQRVASHFSSARATERALEMLTQVDEVRVTETESVLEAALLEVDEIKRLDPPYNVQLRRGERSAWFATRELRELVPAADDAHRLGPLPSERALTGLSALIALADGAEPTPAMRAQVLAVPTAFLPEDALFREAYRAFDEALLRCGPWPARRRVAYAAQALWRARGRTEIESAVDEAPELLWDLARVRRRLERTLVQTGLLLRRARFLTLLAESDVAFREAGAVSARRLTISAGAVAERATLETLELSRHPAPRPCSRAARQAVFDAGVYDRLRVLTTELKRIREEGGQIALRFGTRAYHGERVRALLDVV